SVRRASLMGAETMARLSVMRREIAPGCCHECCRRLQKPLRRSSFFAPASCDPLPSAARLFCRGLSQSKAQANNAAIETNHGGNRLR
ncbi:MAG TPA: hypothetical protein VGC36_02150, partial [Rhizomicrobium sp.]